MVYKSTPVFLRPVGPEIGFGFSWESMRADADFFFSFFLPLCFVVFHREEKGSRCVINFKISSRCKRRVAAHAQKKINIFYGSSYGTWFNLSFGLSGFPALLSLFVIKSGRYIYHDLYYCETRAWAGRKRVKPAFIYDINIKKRRIIHQEMYMVDISARVSVGRFVGLAVYVYMYTLNYGG